MLHGTRSRRLPLPLLPHLLFVMFCKTTCQVCGQQRQVPCGALSSDRQAQGGYFPAPPAPSPPAALSEGGSRLCSMSQVSRKLLSRKSAESRKGEKKPKAAILQMLETDGQAEQQGSQKRSDRHEGLRTAEDNTFKYIHRIGSLLFLTLHKSNIQKPVSKTLPRQLLTPLISALTSCLSAHAHSPTGFLSIVQICQTHPQIQTLHETQGHAVLEM